MLFTAIMRKQRIYLYSILIVVVLCTWFFSSNDTQETAFSEVVKIALRDVGNQLLLKNKDSTSLVLPIKAVSTSKYELSFQSQLTFEPNTLVNIVENSFLKAKLPEAYRVEVIQCSNNEVAYSYEISQQEENTIIPCSGRFLPMNCYTVQVRFFRKNTASFSIASSIYILAFIIFIVMELFFFRKRSTKNTTESDEQYATIGSFLFYPTQNKLVKQATEINLSKKECELLQIFATNLNQVVTRDELTKKVWEDNGVIVGRSLDTYISKLRKKLKDDERIKITNVHGVGYKLELS